MFYCKMVQSHVIHKFRGEKLDKIEWEIFYQTLTLFQTKSGDFPVLLFRPGL